MVSFFLSPLGTSQVQLSLVSSGQIYICHCIGHSEQGLLCCPVTQQGAVKCMHGPGHGPVSAMRGEFGKARIRFPGEAGEKAAHV